MGVYLGSNKVGLNELYKMENKYGWLGSDVTYAGKLYEWNGTLNDTTYSSWTPSTSAYTILVPTSNVASFTIPDRTAETCFVLTRWFMDFAYNSGTTMTCAPVSWCYAGIQAYFNFPPVGDISQYESGEYSSYSTASVDTLYLLKYYSSSGTLSTYNGAYGPAYSTSNASFTPAVSGNTVNVSLSRPTVSARCNNTYFTTARAADIDTTNSTIKYRLDLFRAPRPTIREQHYRMITNMLNNNWEL